MNRSERRSAMERRVGLAPPEECEQRAFLRTLLEASACGLLKGGAEREYLEDKLFEKYPRRASTINRAIDVYGEQRLVELGKGNCKLVDGASILKSYDPARASWALKLHSRLKEWATVKVPTPRGIGEVLLLPKMTGLAQDWLKNVTPTQKRADKIANALRRNSFPVADKWS